MICLYLDLVREGTLREAHAMCHADQFDDVFNVLVTFNGQLNGESVAPALLCTSKD